MRMARVGGDQFGADRHENFPDLAGYSRTNLFRNPVRPVPDNSHRKRHAGLWRMSRVRHRLIRPALVAAGAEQNTGTPKWGAVQFGCNSLLAPEATHPSRETERAEATNEEHAESCNPRPELQRMDSLERIPFILAQSYSPPLRFAQHLPHAGGGNVGALRLFSPKRGGGPAEGRGGGRAHSSKGIRFGRSLL